MRTNVSDWKFAILTSAALVMLASRRPLRRPFWRLGGLGLVGRAILSGYPLGRILGQSQEAKPRQEPGTIAVTERITIAKPAESLFAFFRDLRNLPHVLSRLEHVDLLEGSRSRWIVRGPSGNRLSWEAVATHEARPRWLQWTSASGSQLPIAASVRFQPVSRQSTEVEVRIVCRPAEEMAGAAWLWLAGNSPSSLLGHELWRLKQVVETGAADDEVESAWLSHWVEPQRARLVH